jgi:hypothetical protein
MKTNPFWKECFALFDVKIYRATRELILSIQVIRAC